MSRLLTFLTAAALAGMFLSPNVSAAAHCGDRKAAITILDTKYKERLVAHGISMSGELVELFISSPTMVVGNTWTIAITNPNTRILCLVSAGSMWLDAISVNDVIQ